MSVLHPNVPKFETLKHLAAEYPELDPTAIHACVTLLRVASEMMALLGDHFSGFGLSQGRFTLLMLLRRHPDGLSPAALAKAAGVTRPTITGVLDTLQRDGLVERQPSPHDQRSSIVTLTPAAGRLMRRMLPVHFRRIGALMAGLSVAERKALVGILKQIESRITDGGSV